MGGKKAENKFDEFADFTFFHFLGPKRPHRFALRKRHNHIYHVHFCAVGLE